MKKHTQQTTVTDIKKKAKKGGDWTKLTDRESLMSSRSTLTHYNFLLFHCTTLWCWRNGLTCKIQMEKWDGVILDINSTVDQLGEKCNGILALHALSGCDTVSYPCGKGKVSALKVHMENDIPGLAEVLGEENVSDNDLEEVGTQFFLALYGQKKCSSMTEARKEIYCKRKNPPALKQLPPTSSNLTLHVKRAHLQTMLWKSACNL